MYEIEKNPLFRDERSDTLARRIAEVIGNLQRHQKSRRCERCSGRRCGHEVLMSMVLGYKDSPMCLGCLASHVDRNSDLLAAELGGFVLSKECLRTGWAWVGIREEDEGSNQACPLNSITQKSVGPPRPESPSSQGPPRADREWNAGDMACGDLVLELRLRMQELRPGNVLTVTALDSAAPEDLPAWCRLTGHALVYKRHPKYWIRRKER